VISSTYHLDSRNKGQIPEFAVQAIKILIDILQDENLNLSMKPLTERTLPDVNIPTETRSNAALRLSLVRSLWSVARNVVTNGPVCLAGETFIEWLMANESRLVWESDSDDDARRQWASLCADILVVCDVDEMNAFWGKKVGVTGRKKEWGWTEDVRRLVWASFLEVWSEDKDSSVDGSIVLLSVPFA
jgi:hypothetical protein